MAVPLGEIRRWNAVEIADAIHTGRISGVEAVRSRLGPVTVLVGQLYQPIQQRGGGRLDNSSLILNLRAGAERPDRAS